MELSTIERKDSGIQITYETIGDESAEPLLFLHGLGAGRIQTTRAFTALGNHRLIAPDMLGHGDSVAENHDCVLSFDQFAEDSIAILDDMGIEKANVGGLSMGAGISINIALRFPERVNKLVLLRPCWLSEKKPEHLQLVGFVGQWIEQFGTDKARSLLHDHAVYKELAERLPKVAISIDFLFTRPHFFSHTAVLYCMWQDAPFSNLESLSRITNETLVLCTTRDELHPIPVAQAIDRHLPSSRMLQLPPRYDQPREYGLELNRAIADFLS